MRIQIPNTCDDAVANVQLSPDPLSAITMFEDHQAAVTFHLENVFFQIPALWVALAKALKLR